MRKFESTRVGAGPSKASKDNLTPIRTPTMVFFSLLFLLKIFTLFQASYFYFVMLIHVAISIKDAKVSHFPIAGFQGDSKAFFIDPIN